MLRRILQRRPRPRVPVVLYTRAGCHLCDEMKAEIDRAGLADRMAWSEVDIDTDPELVARFDRSIPVLEIAGRVAFKGRLDARSFASKFERRAQELAG